MESSLQHPYKGKKFPIIGVGSSPQTPSPFPDNPLSSLYHYPCSCPLLSFNLPSWTIISPSSLSSTSLILLFNPSPYSACQFFGGGLVEVNWGWELRSWSQGGLYRGLSVGEDVTLVILAILCSGDFLERSGMSLVSELSCLREISLLSDMINS